METSPPAKRQRTVGELILDIDGSSNARRSDDEDSDNDDSSTSLSSLDSGYARSSRLQTHRQRILRASLEADNSTPDGPEEETTSSSGSEDSESDSDESSDEGDSGDEEDASSSEEATILPTPQTPNRTTAIRTRPNSDIRSRLESFLPQLQRANAELDDTQVLLTKMVDDVSEGAEQYIEMDLSLGVLSERESPTEEVKIPKSSGEEGLSDDMSAAGDRDDTQGDAMEEDVLARLKGETVKRGAKRKVEELE